MNITYPHSEDERFEEPAEGPGGAVWSLLVQVGGGGPTGDRSLRRLCVEWSQLLLHLLGFWFPGSFPEAASLLEAERPPGGQTENFNNRESPEETARDRKHPEAKSFSELLRIMSVSVLRLQDSSVSGLRVIHKVF